jgi:hypothetical protein
MPFALRFSPEAKATLEALASDRSAHAKFRKVNKALAFLEADPRYPGLQSHGFESLTGAHGEQVWESYVENRTPGAWRIWWWYGPERDTITILAIGPHPD